MAENTERKKEPSPLTEEEVDALARKFTASWEAADDAAEAEAGIAQGLPQPGIDKPNLKRTMLGMAPAASALIPNSAEQSASDLGAPNDDSDEELDATAGVPRQRTLLGIQAPDPAYVKKLADSFAQPSAEPASASTEPAVSAAVAEAAPVSPHAPAPSSEPTAGEASAAAARAVPDSPVAAGPAVFASVPANPVALGPAPAPDPVPVSPAPATSSAGPEPAAPPVAAASAPGAPSEGPATEPSLAASAAPGGPGLFGWGEPSEGPPSVQVEIDVEVPSEPGGPSSAVEVQAPARDVAAQAPAVGPGAVAAAPAVAGSAAATPSPAARPAAETTAHAADSGTSGASGPADSAQSYAPPSAPPQPVRSALPADEKTIVIGEEPQPNVPADQAAARLAQQADTIPPERPRLAAEVEAIPDFGQGPRKKARVLVAVGLVALVGVGAVVAMTGGDEAPSASPETEVTSESAKPEKAPAGEPVDTNPEQPESEASEPETDEATSKEAEAAAQAEAEAAAAQAKPAALAPKPVKQTYRPAPKKAPAPKKTSTAPRKAAKPKQPKATSKTIVRDAPF